MRLNYDKIQRNLLREVQLPKCPRFRREAENIVTMLEKIELPPYYSSGEFQQIVTAKYWFYYDNLDSVFTQYPQLHRQVVFEAWLKEATPFENISRACRWLISPESENGGGVITLTPSIRDKAVERAKETRGAYAQVKGE